MNYRELMGDAARSVGIAALLLAVAVFLQGPGLRFIYFAF